MRERYGARDPRSWRLRFHTQTAGVSLTAQQPEVNIARVALEALAGVLGGTQSLHTDAFDEVSAAYKMPKDSDAEKAARTAAIQEALKGATEVPLRVAKAAMETYQLAQIAVQKSNPNVASDARVAMLLAEAAREGARANVDINLAMIKDEQFLARMRDELEGIKG